MRKALRKAVEPAGQPARQQDNRHTDDVLDGQAVLAHLEADRELPPDFDGDAVRGIAIGVLLGAAIWIALATAFVLIWR